MTARYNGPDFEGAINRARKKNISRVLGDLNSRDPNLMKKIKGFSEKFGYDTSVVIEKVRSDEMFRAHFAKDPRKQNIDEKTAFEWLQQLEGVHHLTKLPAAGDGAYYVDKEGYIRNGSAFSGGINPSKSLDFSWTTGNTTFYAMHKRTTDEGGAQDNVKREVEQIMRNFQQCPQEGIALVMLLDGSYWTKEKIQSIAKFARTSEPHSYALSTPRILPVIQKQMSI